MFTGLKPAKPAAVKAQPHYRGEKCLYHAHAGEFDDAKAWRHSETHACMECLEEAKSGRISLDVMKLVPKERTNAFRFWSRIDINEWDECWQWTKELSKSRHLFSYWHRPTIGSSYKYHPIQVMNWLSRGDLGKCGTISLCGERRCCNPLHQIPLGIEQTDHDMEYLEEQRTLLLSQLVEHYRPKLVDPKVITVSDEYADRYTLAMSRLVVRQL